MQISLNGRRVFITAGAGGIGRATAEVLAAAGAEVFVCDIDEAGLAGLPDGIKGYVCDVGDSAAVDYVLGKVLSDGLDILINNAGVAGPTKAVEEITDDEWRGCMGVCIDAQFYCARRVVPIFKQQGGGVIINLASAAGIMGLPNRSAYVAAKWAVVGLTKTLAMELGGDGIRVNAVVPGNVSGDRMGRVIAAHAEATGVSEAKVRRDYCAGVSMGCFVEPQEIAAMICFLCSDNARHISGQVIGVDGHTETMWIRG